MLEIKHQITVHQLIFSPKEKSVKGDYKQEKFGDIIGNGNGFKIIYKHHKE